jgi:DNA polymerase III subunit beta
MKVVCPKSVLLDALGVASSIVTSRSTLPILANVLIECGDKEISLTTTDLEIGLMIKIEATVEEKGCITIPAKNLLDKVRELPEDDVTLYTEESKVHIDCQRYSSTIMGIMKEEFPNPPEVDEKSFVKLPAKALHRMVSKTIISVSTESTRYSLNGILYEIKGSMLKLVATDGRRLSLIKGQIENLESYSKSMIIPSKANNELLKVLSGADDDTEVTIRLGDNFVAFICGAAVLTTRLVDGQFPDYEKVIPNSFEKRLKAPNDEIIKVTRRIAISSNEKRSSVKYSINTGSLTVSANDAERSDFAVEELPVEYEGKTIETAYNSRYLIEILKAVDSKDVVFEMNESVTPAMIRGADEDEYFSILMPMTLEEMSQ